MTTARIIMATMAAVAIVFGVGFFGQLGRRLGERLFRRKR